MTSKEYLSQYKLMQARIDRLESDLRLEQDKRDSISINYDGMPHGTDVTSRTENIAVKIADLEWKIKESIAEAKALQNEIKLVIEGIGKGKENPYKWETVKEVLTAIYLESYKEDRKSRYRPTIYKVVQKHIPYGDSTIRLYHVIGLREIENEIQQKGRQDVTLLR